MRHYIAEEPVTTSLKNAYPAAPHEVYKGDDFFVTDSRGWIPALEQLGVPSSKMKLGHTVSKVAYTDAGATVTAVRNADNTTVTFTADYVVSTFSLGVLQEKHDTMVRTGTT